MPHDKTMRVVSIGLWDDRLGEWVGGDKAFDTSAPNWRAARAAYDRDRTSSEARDALPLRAGMSPRVFELAMPTTSQKAAIDAATTEAHRCRLACLYAVASVTGHNGDVRRPERREGVATDAWLELLEQCGGVALVRELGAVIYRRMVSGDPDEGADPLAF